MNTLKSIPISFGIILLPLYTIFVLFLSDSEEGKILYQSKQPETINYNSFDPYVLQITEGNIKWRTFSWPKSKILKITKINNSSYGHFIELDVLGADFSQVVTNWNNGGVEIILNTKHQLKIPKESFIGGR